MKWQVGQWVEWGGDVFRIDAIHDTHMDGQLNGSSHQLDKSCYASLKPFAWQVGKTYRTTMPELTATITNIGGGVVSADVCGWKRGFCAKTGIDIEPSGKPSGSDAALLPFLTDEPIEPEPTLTERYTLDHDGGPWWLVRDNQSGKVLKLASLDLAEHVLKLAKSGEGLFGWKTEEASKPQQPDPINPQHYRNHPSGVECIEIVEHMSYSIGTAMAYLWRAGKKGPAVEDLKKAKWFISREIERLEKGGAE